MYFIASFKNNVKITLPVFLIVIFLMLFMDCRKDSLGLQISYDRQKTLKSLEKVNDYPFYTMVYYDNYGFREYLNGGDLPSFFASIVPEDNQFACTCFAAMGSDTCRVFGRNYDWNSHIILMLFTSPSDGYKSISTIHSDCLGYSETNTPDAMDNRERLLQAPYHPNDGMNEKGVAIGVMCIDRAEPPYTAGKVTLYGSFLVRLVLDYAATVEEAIGLIQGYNVSFEYGLPLHYLIADATGQSAIIEFIDNEMKVINNNESWQVSTNFIIFGTEASENASCWRYNRAYDILNEKNGNINNSDAMNILSQVAVGPPYHTISSTVYNLKILELDIAIDRKYTEIYHFSLNDFK